MIKELLPQEDLCSICSSADVIKFNAHAFDTETPTFVHLTQCKNCHFAWQYPLGRTANESIRHFDLNYNSKNNDTPGYFDPTYKKQIANLEYDFVSTLLTNGNSLLDIGAGAGIFAEIAAENGWIVTAIDPALDDERLKNINNVNPIRGNTESIEMDEQFDIVTLWDVIEHVEKPIETITDAFMHLNDQGWIVIETGNYKSADRLEGGINHWMFQLDHRWYFSPESITKILIELGFTDIVFAQKTLRPGWTGNTEYLGPSFFNLVKSIIKNPFRSKKAVSLYRELLRAKKWPMAGIGIFTVAGKKSTIL